MNHEAHRTVSALGEKRLIADIVNRYAGSPESGIGVGDDAAILMPPSGAAIVVSTDKIPEDLLALRFELMDPRSHGRYLAEVNISDVVAMGARPSGLLMNVAVPADYPLQSFIEFVEGFAEAAERHGAPLVGGDTSWASVPMFAATAIGWVDPAHALRRMGARLGDRIAVTGNVGDFGAALAYFQARHSGSGARLPASLEQVLLERLTRPRARADLLAAIEQSSGIRAGMDITDGLHQSLEEFVAASGLGAVISWEKLPISEASRAAVELIGAPLEEVVFGIGLDLELLLAISPDAQLAEELRNEITFVGEFVAEQHLRLRCADELAQLPGRGWQHFFGDAESMVASPKDLRS